MAALAAMTACSSDTGEAAPVVPVEIVAVEKSAMQQKITADAVLFPVEQSAIPAKISAPVKKFLVNRGSHVRDGQLLAVLENRDLAAAAQENKGALRTGTGAIHHHHVGRSSAGIAESGARCASGQTATRTRSKRSTTAGRIWCQQGALPRKDLDQAGVDLTNARNQYELAQKHLDSLNAIGKQLTLQSAAGQLASAQGKYEGAAAQLSYSEIRSPINGVVTERPLYPGEMAAAGTPLLTVMDISEVIAKAHIPQPSAALLKVGDTAEIEVPGMDKPVPGQSHNRQSGA